jgi:exosortase H (IPTLxxWG-CTERM-specific)
MANRLRTRRANPHPRRPSPTSGDAGRRQPGFWPGVRFSATVLGLLVLFFLATRSPWVDREVVVPYTAFVTKSAALLLRTIGVDVSNHGNVIASQTFSVSILPVCNGLEVTAIYVAAVLAFPAASVAKAIGFLGGLAVIYLINLIRIAALFQIGARYHVAFEQVHYYYAQAFVIIVTVCIWLLWVSLFTDYGRTNRRLVSG